MIELRGQADEDNPVFSFWLMKFFPVAFFVTFDEPLRRLYSFADLDSFGASPYDQQHEISFSLSPMIGSNWPEQPTDHHVILFGEQAHAATPMTKIQRT